MAGREGLAIALILLFAAAIRLWHVGFGLPSLNDPDEPLFIMVALDMLREHRLNPEWFGHPATILFYALALISILVGMAGMAIGQWVGVNGFVAALFQDPGIVALPARIFIVLCGVATIWLTWRVGRRAINPRVGLIAAVLLACNALHIDLSRIIRTDMLATVFMLWSTLEALKIAERGRWRNHLFAGVAVGLACATKWPAAMVLANAMSAALFRAIGHRAEARRVLIAPLAALVTLLVVSPYLLLDYTAVLRDLHGEARAFHPGQTGGGLFHNLGWYIRLPLAETFGIVGVVLAAIGLVLALRRYRAFTIAVLPGAALFFVVIAGQFLVWERWIVPLLPVVALLSAIAIDAAASFPRRTAMAQALLIALVGVVTVPMLRTTLAAERMRANDTRQVATEWVRAHVPEDKSVLVEHAAFDLLRRPGRLLFPLGSAGCIDVAKALGGRPSYRKVDNKRSGRAIVDVGHVDADRLPGCRADILIFSHYARYEAEPAHYQPQLANYRALMRGARLMETIRPIPNERGGPVIHIFATGAAELKPAD